MRRLRGFLAGYLGLVALSALVTEQGSRRASGLLGTLTSIVERALSPAVPAIPDYAAGGAGAPAGGGGAGDVAGAAAAAAMAAAKTMGTRPTTAAGGGAVPGKV